MVGAGNWTRALAAVPRICRVQKEAKRGEGEVARKRKNWDCAGSPVLRDVRVKKFSFLLLGARKKFAEIFGYPAQSAVLVVHYLIVSSWIFRLALNATPTYFLYRMSQLRFSSLISRLFANGFL
jgi:hypothetical protein